MAVSTPGCYRSDRTLAGSRKETERPCSPGPRSRDSPKGETKSGSARMVSHPSRFSIADSAKVWSGKRCAATGSTPISYEDFGSLRSCYRAWSSFDLAMNCQLYTMTYLFFELLILNAHSLNVFFHLLELGLLLESALLG